MFSFARCVFINPCQVRQNIFHPLHKFLCIFLLFGDYRVPHASVNTVCGAICCSYIVKFTRTIDPWFFCQGTTYHGFFLLHFSLGTTNTDLKLCYIWTKVDIFSLGFYFSSFIEILATYKTTNHKFYNFHSIIRKCKRNMKY